MTDKQIIIDGIDVSECIYYDNGKCLNDEMVQCSCKKVAVCYYKEYKRKEQECKNNKTAYQIELDIYNQECLNLQEELKETLEQLDQLKAENEELKRQLTILDDEDVVVEITVKQFEEYKKLKQTLAEIKEIAERDKEFCIKCNGNKEIDCVDCIEGGRALLAKDILQKISEVEDEKV